MICGTENVSHSTLFGQKELKVTLLSVVQVQKCIFSLHSVSNSWLFSFLMALEEIFPVRWTQRSPRPRRAGAEGSGRGALPALSGTASQRQGAGPCPEGRLQLAGGCRFSGASHKTPANVGFKNNFEVCEWLHVLLSSLMTSKVVRAEKGSWPCLCSPLKLPRPKEEQWLCRVLSHDVPFQEKNTHQKNPKLLQR